MIAGRTEKVGRMSDVRAARDLLSLACQADAKVEWRVRLPTGRDPSGDGPQNFAAAMEILQTVARSINPLSTRSIQPVPPVSAKYANCGSYNNVRAGGALCPDSSRGKPAPPLAGTIKLVHVRPSLHACLCP